MISIQEAYGWLNRFEPSHITGAVMNALMNQVEAGRATADQIKTFEEQAINGASANPDPQMLPEVLARLALAAANRGDLVGAEKFAGDAARVYKSLSDRHREAVTQYLMGLIQGRMTFRNAQSSTSLTAGREKFQALAGEQLFGANSGERAWYMDVLTRINVNQVGIFETAYAWLQMFDTRPTHLQSSNQILRERLNAAVIGMNYPAARSIITLLIDTSSDSDDRIELPEALLACARAEYDMGNPEKAGELLRRASAIYPPRSHWQAVTRWLLGIVLWGMSGSSADALQAWQQAIGMFQEQATRADQRNNQAQKDWYILRSAEMQAALTERLETSA